MKKISFLDDTIESVLNGQKTETLRLNENFNIEETVILTRQSGEELGYLKILDKSEIKFSNLTNEDAKKHAWNSVSELKERLLRIYPKLIP